MAGLLKQVQRMGNRLGSCPTVVRALLAQRVTFLDVSSVTQIREYLSIPDRHVSKIITIITYANRVMYTLNEL
jgi:hypothetical protein